MPVFRRDQARPFHLMVRNWHRLGTFAFTFVGTKVGRYLLLLG